MSSVARSLLVLGALLLPWSVVQGDDQVELEAPDDLGLADAEAADDPSVLDADVDVLGTADAHIRLHDLSLDMAMAARQTLHRRAQFRPDDCVKYVWQVGRAVGVPMYGGVGGMAGVAGVYDALHYDPVPFVGDLVFWHNTYDKNKNHKWDDTYTHIGIVLDVHDDGTVVMAHKGKTREVIYMNLYRPDVFKDEATGKVLNSWLRKPKRGDPSDAGYLTGQLWSGYATVRKGQNWNVRYHRADDDGPPTRHQPDGPCNCPDSDKHL